MDHDFKETFEKVILFFEKNNIFYALIGAWASSFWGQPRGTEDIDFLILMAEDELQRLKENIESLSPFKIDKDWEKYNPMARSRHCRLLSKNIHVDITLSRDIHDEEVLKRRILKTVGDFKMYIGTPEDIILMKIKAGRAKDLPDALAIFIKQQKNIDFDYLRDWSKKLGTYEELNWLFTKV